MSEENVEIVRRQNDALDRGALVRRAVDAWNARDPDLWRTYATPDIEWTPAGPAAVEGTVYRGSDEVVAGLEAVWETWEEVHFEETELRELGGALLWLGRLKLRGASSHVALDQEFAIRFVLNDGKLAAIHAFLSREDALRAAGLAE
jgi:ketosteroid isomerase-like protein